jgi:predicted TIM-barrel fold metal-dependent hydrolase
MQKKPLAIVDAHHHLWNLTQGHYPWLQDAYIGDKFFLGAYRQLCQDYTHDAYRGDTLGYQVVGSVHIEAERSRQEQVQETRWLERQHAEYDVPSVIVGHVSLLQPDLDDVLQAHCASPLMRGIRSKPVTAAQPNALADTVGKAGTMQDPQWLDGLAKLAPLGLSWDLRVPYWHLLEAAQVAHHFPDLQIVLNHTGLPLDRNAEGLAIWQRGMTALANAPNVYVKLSELGLRGGRWDPASNHRVLTDTISLFGAQRVMFASNLPVSSLSASFSQIVDAVLSACGHLGDEAVSDIFANNAMRFYRI